jgi:serine protease Do
MRLLEGFLGLVLCLTACQFRGDRETHMPTAERVPAFLDDSLIMAQMTQAVSEAMDEASPVSMSQLIATLQTEPTAKVALPKTAQGTLSEVQESITIVGGVYQCNRCTRWHVAPSSGFLIADDLLVTNYHVVNQPSHQAMAVRLFDGRVLMVKEVVAASRENDLVVLRIPSTGLKPIALGAAAPVGAQVDLISHPKQRFYTLSEGRISRYFIRRQGERQTPMMSITADFGRGSSGAPVLNKKGQVVGIATSTESAYYSEEDGQQKNLQMVFKHCIPVQQLRKLIGG